MNFVTAATQAGVEDRIVVFPVWSTFGILIVVVVELIVAGILLKRKWLEKHEALPIPAALAMFSLMMSLYVLVGSLLYFSSSPQQRPQILFWLFILYIPLGIQYALNVVNAIVWYMTQRVSPLGDEIPEAPVATLAQKQIMAGKIDDAIATFTNFYERRAPALAEVARLLKTEGKFDQAKAIYEELVEKHSSDRVIWPEAVYTLAKIYETQMGKAQEAIKLYKSLLDQAPESRFTHMAGADMARLMIMDASFVRSLNNDDDREIPEDPFFAQRRNFLKQRMELQERLAKVREEEEEEAEEETIDQEEDMEESSEENDEIGDDDDDDEIEPVIIDKKLNVTVRGKTGIRKKAASPKIAVTRRKALSSVTGPVDRNDNDVEDDDDDDDQEDA